MRILLAVNDSVPSMDALQVVLSRPWPKGSVIRAITCVSTIWMIGMPGTAISGALLDISRKELLRQAKRVNDVVVAVLAAHKLSAQAIVREGDPVYRIVHEARIWGADLIIVGTHNHKRFKKLIYGSVAQAIVRRAPCSVEVVKRRAKRKWAAAEAEALYIRPGSAGRRSPLERRHG